MYVQIITQAHMPVRKPPQGATIGWFKQRLVQTPGASVLPAPTQSHINSPSARFPDVKMYLLNYNKEKLSLPRTPQDIFPLSMPSLLSSPRLKGYY